MIFVDQGEHKSDGKFAYYNKCGEVEGIIVDDDMVVVSIRAGEMLTDFLAEVYVEDIPNLIKALQAAYNFCEKNNGKA